MIFTLTGTCAHCSSKSVWSQELGGWECSACFCPTVSTIEVSAIEASTCDMTTITDRQQELVITNVRIHEGLGDRL